MRWITLTSAIGILSTLVAPASRCLPSNLTHDGSTAATGHRSVATLQIRNIRRSETTQISAGEAVFRRFMDPLQSRVDRRTSTRRPHALPTALTPLSPWPVFGNYPRPPHERGLAGRSASPFQAHAPPA
jgi:hypothetical protein